MRCRHPGRCYAAWLWAAAASSLVARLHAYSPGFTGLDVVLVVGQSNAVGAACSAPTPEEDAALSLAGLPVFILRAGSRDWNDQGDAVVHASERQRLSGPASPTSGGTHHADFGVPFAARFVASGYLAPGRAVLLVNAAVGDTGVFKLCGTDTLGGGWPARPATHTHRCWAPSAACSPDLVGVDEALKWPSQSLPNASLLTRAIDFAELGLAVDPATLHGPPRGAVLPARMPGNRIVAILWHQGEADARRGDCHHGNEVENEIRSSGWECLGWEGVRA